MSKEAEEYLKQMLNRLIESEAHALWLECNKENGKALEHWIIAEKRILAEIKAFEDAISANDGTAKQV